MSAEITLGELIADLQVLQKEHGSEPLVCFNEYDGERLVVKTTRTGRNRAESGHIKIRVILDIEF